MPQAFTELLITKFCHDIAGNIGGVKNGVEFLTQGDLEPELKSGALDLLDMASSNLQSNFKFFRTIYGTAKQFTSTSELKKILENFFSGKRINYNFTFDCPDTEISGKCGQLFLNIAYIALNQAGKGDTLDIYLSKKENWEYQVKAHGKNIITNPEIDTILSKSEANEANIYNVQIHLTAQIANSLGCVIKSDMATDKLSLSIEVK